MSEQEIVVGSRWRSKGKFQPGPCISVCVVLAVVESTHGERRIVYEFANGLMILCSIENFLRTYELAPQPIRRGQMWIDKLGTEVIVIHVENGVVHAFDDDEILPWEVADFCERFTYLRDVEIVEEEL